MVRVNLIEPKKLADQHLIAEYAEILMLAAYIRKYPGLGDIPRSYCLGKGHMTFFKDKMAYLKMRHESLKTEMRKRGFRTDKTINLLTFRKENKGDWEPKHDDIRIITERLISKLQLKPEYYRYYGRHESPDFFIRLLRN